ncbi:MAG: 3'(2'),5'-bisphosphate nucleotidase CysQ [Bacteroidales bacterium]
MLDKKQISRITDLITTAGEEIMKIYKGDNFYTTLKADNSPVTLADITSDSIIKTGLSKITPAIKVFSEETKDIPYETRSTWDPLWILDPLDGTREFVARNDEFCISLALVSKGNPVAGFIQAPVTGEIWYAIKGKGAFFISGGKKRDLKITSPGKTRVINVSRSNHVKQEAEWIEKVKKQYEVKVISQGSAIKFCRVATGQTHMYPKYGRIHEWDIAAGHLIIEEAGGVLIETATGKPPRYNKEDYHQASFIAFAPGIADWKNWI